MSRKEQKKIQTGAGVVRQVLSGDTVILQIGPPTNGPPPEMEISLAGLSAPRLGRGDTADEPFAWRSREFLRRRCIGKRVQYTIEHSIQLKSGANKHFGTLVLMPGNENLHKSVVAAGWARVKANPKGSSADDARAQLVALSAEAEKDKRGVFASPTKKSASRHFLPQPTTPDDFVTQWRGLQVPAVVEHVRDGSMVRVTLVPQLAEVAAQKTAAAAAAAAPKPVAPAAAAAPKPAAAPAPAPEPEAAAAGPEGTSKSAQKRAKAAAAKAAAAAAAAAAAPAPAATPAASTAAATKKPKPAPVALEGPAAGAARLNGHFLEVMIRLSGVQTPSIGGPGRADEASRAPEPYAREARFFTESLALHQDAVVTIEGTDKRGGIYGSITVGGRSLTEALLREGLGRLSEWNAPADSLQSLRDAQLHAQTTQTRLWRGYVAPDPAALPASPAAAGGAAGGRDGRPKPGAALEGSTAQVRFIETGGVIQLDCERGQVRSVALSSLIVPRCMVGSANVSRDEPLGWEAREFLRSRLHGKRVTVLVDYARQIGGAGPVGASSGSSAAAAADPESDKPLPSRGERERLYCSLLVDGKVNIATALVEAGLAKVRNHRSDDERSRFYDQLLAAEMAARQALKGVHAKGASVLRLTSFSGEPAVAQRQLPFMQRAGRMPAVVEWVLSGTKLKLSVAKEGWVLPLALTGVRSADRGSELSNAAMEWMREQLLQADVEILIEGFMPKSKSFSGYVYRLVKGERPPGSPANAPRPIVRRDVALDLLEAGLAKIIPAALRANPSNAQIYKDAELAAKTAEKGMWKGWAEQQRALADAAASDDAAGASSVQKRIIKITVTEVMSAHTVYVQEQGEAQRKLDAAVALLRADGAYPPPPPREGEEFVPRRGDVCLAQFSADDEWYRARVLTMEVGGGADDEDQFTVTFIDYGNSDVVPQVALRPLPSAIETSVIAPLAKECVLANIIPPDPEDDEELADEAAFFLKELVFGKNLVASVEGEVGGRLIVSLGDPETKLHVGASMLRAGFGRLAHTPQLKRDPDLFARLDAEEKLARREHLGLWHAGDRFADDDDEL